MDLLSINEYYCRKKKVQIKGFWVLIIDFNLIKQNLLHARKTGSDMFEFKTYIIYENKFIYTYTHTRAYTHTHTRLKDI